MKNKKFYLGLDIGTDSVGYAVTDTNYIPIKYHGENMLGTHTFDAANSSAERRGARTSRRLTQRKRQRINLLQEIFSKPISDVDPYFFIRLKESALYKEDKNSILPSADSIFADENYTDSDYHREYPTIHHLITSLMNSNKVHDVRLVYLACAYLVAHRGHFLSEVDKTNVGDVLDFNTVYTSFCRYFEENEIPMPWEGDANKIGEILKSKNNISTKEKELYKLLYNGKKPKTEEEYPYDKACIIKLICGGQTKAKSLYKNPEYSEIDDISLNNSDENLIAIFSDLGDDAQLIVCLKAIYDWSVLSGILKDFSSLSTAKVAVYEQHKQDLKNLKDFIKKYIPEKFDEIFKISNDKLPNYTAYSGNFKWVNKKSASYEKSNKENFLKYLKGVVSKINVDDKDAEFYNSMLSRIDTGDFLPKQVNTDNRVIPYQLYYDELTKILKIASQYLPFLTEKDSDGYVVMDKIISVFEFRIPYFVGPLRKDNSKHAWIKRRAEGKIYPWNFKNMVDYDKSEEAFIRKMTNKCTYLAGEPVLPKNSLLYSKYMVLNEINNIKINDKPIDVVTKQGIYNLFLINKIVTPKKIQKHLESEAQFKDGDIISGIDVSIKSALTSYHAFKRLLTSNTLTETDVEQIIERMAYTEEKKRMYKWLGETFSSLSESDRKYISSLRLKGFGRMSKKLLAEFSGTNKETGEIFTIINALWETNENFMQLLSGSYTFSEEVERFSKEYYLANPRSLEDRLNEMYISNLVKRPIYRTLDILKDIRKIMGDPDKIFIETARDFYGDKKGKRTKSRRDTIKEFYKNIPSDEVHNLLKELEGKTDPQLQSERLYLYFMQLGKCMYSGETIDINSLLGKTYDVDHIYPRCFVKDDSLTNKVLVLSKLNGEKGNSFPIDLKIRQKMTPFWQMLLKNDMIGEEKFKRLTRITSFSENERWGFINRQLVETSQSTKVIAALLKEMLPDTEIVYVKAGLVSEFRHAFDIVKSRSVNDLHHAKDAYLNIVAGNVYNSYFTKRNSSFSLNNYTINIKSFFEHPKTVNSKTIWRGAEDIELVKKIVANNHIHYTNYAYCQKGILFDLQPLKAGANDNLVPRKKGLAPAKYGGYSKSKATFFTLVKYTGEKSSGKKTKLEQDVIFMPVELMYADKFKTDDNFAKEYSKQTISVITNCNVTNVEFPFGKRNLKVRTALSIDGFYAFLRGKKNSGSQIILSSMNSIRVDSDTESYIKHIDSFIEKLKNDKNRKIDSVYDKITAEKNLELYDFYLDKLSKKPFNVCSCFKGIYDIINNGRDKFIALTIEEQAQCLANIILLLKTGRAGTADLTLIGGGSSSGAFTLSSKLSNLSKNYKDIRIIDISASGLYKKESENLFDLL